MTGLATLRRWLVPVPRELVFLLVGAVLGLWLLGLGVLVVSSLTNLLGLLVLLPVIATVRLVQAAERARLRLMGVAVPAPRPGSPTGRLRQVAAALLGPLDADRWRHLLLLAGSGPMSAVAVAVPGALAVSGLLDGHWGRVDAALPGGLALPAGPGWAVRVTAAGLLVSAVLLVRVLAAAQARAAQSWLCGGADRMAQVLAGRARAVDAQTAELRRIEQNLHDGAQARLVALTMQLAALGRSLRPLGPEADRARAELSGAVDTAGAALAELRRLVRGILPPVLTDRGLDAALSALAEDCALPVDLDRAAGGRTAPAVETAAYFVAAEALANAAKHAGATHCRVRTSRGPDSLRIEIADDGRGGADPGGPGLTGLRYRVEALDGTLGVTSPPGGPTTVRAELPCG